MYIPRMSTPRFDHKRWCSLHFPGHKSQLQAIAGTYGCPKRFAYDCAKAITHPEDTSSSSDRARLGDVTHEVIAAHLVSGTRPRDVTHACAELRERADLSSIPGDLIAERAQMIVGLFAPGGGIDRHVLRVIAVESGFIAPFGPYWLSGHVDLVYEPRTLPGTVAICDWKTGAQKPHAIELDHGWEAGIYSAALVAGYFMPRARPAAGDGSATGAPATAGGAGHYSRRELEARLIDAAAAGACTKPTYGCFPSAIHHVHLGDYVPYRRAGKKQIHRPEDLLHYGYREPQQHGYVAGDLRGGAWIPVRLTELDLIRFGSRLRKIVSVVRLGHMFDRVGEHCSRCEHREPCLVDGYEQTYTAAEAAALRKAIKEDGEEDYGIE
jgi:hypothetical protein